MGMQWQSLWDFRTKHYHVACEATFENGADVSWADEETLEQLNSGELSVYGVRVVVRKAGIEIGEDSLWGCVYHDIDDFVRAHRDRDPMKRNSSIVRAANGGNVVICHYFPGMVSEAIKQARQKLEQLAA